MSVRCMALVSSVLKDLGHKVPSDSELEKLLAKAVAEIKAKEGISGGAIDLRLAAVDMS